jgi:hypothetical protein
MKLIDVTVPLAANRRVARGMRRPGSTNLVGSPGFDRKSEGFG